MTIEHMYAYGIMAFAVMILVCIGITIYDETRTK